MTEVEIWRQSLIDAALDAVLVIDEEGTLVDFNESAEQMFGYRKDAVLGNRMSDLIIPPKLREAHNAGLSRLKSTTVPKILGKRLELEAMRSDGTTFPVELMVVQVPIQPSPLYVGYVRDISGRKEVEDSLRASAKRFQALADSAPLMIWLAASDGTVAWCNKSWLEFTGNELGETIGRRWFDNIHPSDLLGYMHAYQRLQRTGYAFSMEYRMLHSDGGYRWVLANVAATLSANREMTGFAGSCVDITSRREAEAALRLTQFAVDGAAEAIFWVRPDASVHYVNHQACKALGYTKKELRSMKLTDFSASRTEVDWHRLWEEVCSKKQLTYEAAFCRCDGTTYPVEITVAQIQFDDDDYACMFVRDISERLEAQAQLAAAMRQAQVANDAKSEFLAVISHEMRTPLNSIIGTIDLALGNCQHLEKQEIELLTQCYRSGIQLRELINDVLDYSQIGVGKFSLQSNPMDLLKLLDRIRDSFMQRAQEKGLEFRWRVDRSFPALAMGDQRRLSQVIENLLANAIKFTNSGFIAFRAEVESGGSRPTILRFTIEDSGVGIKPKNRERIFQRFEQLDTGPTRVFGGVGLGLSICKQLVELMGGEIHVETGSEGGSKFVFTGAFDLPPEGSAQVHTRETHPTPTIGRKTLSGLTVLLVEDDPPSRLLAERMLVLCGVQVTAVEDGLAAVEAVRKEPDHFDAILMDVMMPRLDGIEATKQIRQLQKRRVPVIATTAQAMEGDRERILRSEVDAYLAKPIDRQIMLRTLAELTGRDVVSNSMAPASRKREAALINMPALRTQCDEDDELLAEIAGLFERTCQESMAQLKAGIEASDRQAVISAVHRLKGSVGNLCAPRVFDFCQEMESNARNAGPAAVVANVEQLRSLLKSLHEELNQYLDPQD